MPQEFKVKISAFDINNAANYHPSTPMATKYDDTVHVIFRSLAPTPMYAEKPFYVWNNSTTTPFNQTVKFPTAVHPNAFVQAIFGPVVTADKTDPTRMHSPSWAATYGSLTVPVKDAMAGPYTAPACSSSDIPTPWNVSVAAVPLPDGEKPVFASNHVAMLKSMASGGPKFTNTVDETDPELTSLATSLSAGADMLKFRVAPEDRTQDTGMAALFSVAIDSKQLITSAFKGVPMIHTADSLEAAVDLGCSVAGVTRAQFVDDCNRVFGVLHSTEDAPVTAEDQKAASNVFMAVTGAAFPSSRQYNYDTAFAAAINPRTNGVCVAPQPAETSDYKPSSTLGEDCEDSARIMKNAFEAVQRASGVAKSTPARMLVDMSQFYVAGVATGAAASASAQHDAVGDASAQRSGVGDGADRFTKGVTSVSFFEKGLAGHAFGLAVRATNSLQLQHGEPLWPKHVIDKFDKLLPNNVVAVLEGTAAMNPLADHPSAEGSKQVMSHLVALHAGIKNQEQKKLMAGALNAFGFMAPLAVTNSPVVDSRDPMWKDDSSFVRRANTFTATLPNGDTAMFLVGTRSNTNPSDVCTSATLGEVVRGVSADGKRTLAFTPIPTAQPIDPMRTGNSLSYVAAIPPDVLTINKALTPPLPKGLASMAKKYPMSSAKVLGAPTAVFFPGADPAMDGSVVEAIETIARSVGGRLGIEAKMIPAPGGRSVIVARMAIGKSVIPSAALPIAAQMHPDALEHLATMRAAEEAIRKIELQPAAAHLRKHEYHAPRRPEFAAQPIMTITGAKSFTRFGDKQPTVIPPSIQELAPLNERQRARAIRSGLGPVAFPWFGAQPQARALASKPRPQASASKVAPGKKNARTPTVWELLDAL